MRFRQSNSQWVTVTVRLAVCVIAPVPPVEEVTITVLVPGGVPGFPPPLPPLPPPHELTPPNIAIRATNAKNCEPRLVRLRLEARPSAIMIHGNSSSA